MEATAKNGDAWTGEKSESWWVYRDKAGRLYESREVPVYRIRMNATQVQCADGRLAIMPLRPEKPPEADAAAGTPPAKDS